MDVPVPSGVVTFLLTDIVDSTQLWDENPTGMGQALSRLDAIIRQAVETYGGVLLKARGEGDSTFSVFERATGAIQACRAMWLAMQVEAWPEGLPVQIRVAVHTGEALERDGDYYGPTVNRASRLRALASAGQVLLSQATASLVLDHLPTDCFVELLGEHALRGLARTETVYELRVAVPSAHGAPETGGRLPLPASLVSPPMAGFHGREEERTLLNRLLQETRYGARRAVFIAGEAGVGKSALAAELAREAHALGGAVLYGRCEEDIGVPYQPWAEVLAQLVRHASTAVLSNLGPRRQADLLQLVPQLGERVAVTPTSNAIDVEAAQYLLFGAVVATLGQADRSAPMVIVLDDLQWADPQSLRLLRHVLGLADAPPMLLIATYRDSDIDPSSGLHDLLAASRRQTGVERLSLNGLSVTELLALMESAAGQPFTGRERELVEAVHAETDGNPFFAWEIMLHLSETGMVAVNDEGRWIATSSFDAETLPDSVREVIGRRVVRLGPEVLRVLEMAAVVGAESTLELLTLVLEDDEDEVLELLEAAEAAGLLRTTRQATFAFAHELIGHSVYASMSRARKLRCHHLIAKGLEELGVGTAAELAHHWSLAGASEGGRVVAYARQAAERALAAFAPQDAVRWYESALDHLPARGPDLDQERCALQVGLGTAQAQAGEPAFRATLLAAAAHARALGTADLLVAAALANSRGLPGVVDLELIEVLESAIEVAGDASQADRARLLASLCAQLIVGFPLDRRQDLATEALEVARASGDESALLAVLNLVTPSIAVPGNLAARRALTREAVLLADQLDDPVAGCLARHQLAQVALECGDLLEADRSLSGMRALAERLTHPVLRWMLMWSRSGRALMAGDIDAAEALAEQSLQLGMETGQPDALTIYSGQLFCIRWHQGRDGELLELMQDAASERPDLPILQAAVARLTLEAGQPEPVDADQLSGDPSDLAWAGSMVVWAEVAAQCGSTAACELIYEALRPHPTYVVHVQAVFLGSVSHYLGLLAAALGRAADAREHFQEATRMHQLLDAPFHLARTKLELGRVLLEAGEEADAFVLLEEAALIAKEFGCAQVEQRARDLMAD